MGVRRFDGTCPDKDIDLYADDSTMYKSAFYLIQIESKLQGHLFRIQKGCTINNISLHPSKPKCMLIGSKHNMTSLLDTCFASASHSKKTRKRHYKTVWGEYEMLVTNISSFKNFFRTCINIYSENNIYMKSVYLYWLFKKNLNV